MGNAASSSGGQQLPDSGEATAAAGGSHHQQQAPDTSIHSSTKSWATMDHSISGPWSFLMKEEVQCLCEGGRSCSHENPARQKAPNAIAGLHSSWVSDQVLAMARPWQDNVLKHDVVSQFKQHNIGMILNLQEVGEHESCGPGNLAVSGFTYNPETFMAAKIGVYNISWRDMGVPTLEKMMDMVQIMHYTTSVECRKVAVHCHAGLGRTGLAIACFLLASGQAASAARAVETVRAARPGSLQTQAQVVFVSIFEQYLQHLRCMFKVADLKQLSLGNTNYVVTKVCRRISRSLSGMHQASNTGTPDALAAAAAALEPLAFTPTGSGGSGASSAPGSATAVTAAAAAAAQGQPDWASAMYDVLSASEAAQLVATPAEVANASANASAGLNLGPAMAAAAAAAAAASGSGGAGSAAAGAQDSSGLVMHARRLSGGAAMKMVSNLRAIEEEGDRPVHVIQTDNAVTELYGHGLTIIRATDSVKKMYAGPAGAKPPAQPAAADQQQQLTAHDLGLDKQLPWNDKFAIRPEAFKAEGWLPDPPASYLEALRRQQRLLHGQERRRCLHQHKLLRAAAKALAAAAEAYNAVPAHTDAVDVLGPGAASQSPPFKRTHTRSRSNATAIDLLAVTGSLSPCGSVPQADLRRPPSGGGSLQHVGSGLPAAAGGAAGSSGSTGGGLMSKQQQQLVASASGVAAAAAAGGFGGTGAAPAPESAAALLPGLHLGPPGTNSGACSSSGAGISRTASGARKLARKGSSAKGRKSAHSPGQGAAAGQAQGDFFLSCDGSSAPPALTAAAPPGGPAASASGGTAPPSCTPLLSGCCAPSFAVGLLIALLYKGRFPEEFEVQWAGCPRLKALGLDEGHAVCQALQDVKLAVNVGFYAPLESASGAVALCVLADWFEGFSEEAFTESTLEMLVDDAESMLAESLAAAAMARTQEAQPQQQAQGGGSSSGRASVGHQTTGAAAAATAAANGHHLPTLKLPGANHQEPAGGSSSGGHGPVSSMQIADEAAGLARKAAARAACTALAPFEQDMCLLLAAVLRHARHASLDDPRLQELGLNYSSSGANPTGSWRLSSAGGAPPAGGSGSQSAAAAVEAQVDAAMAVLYRLVAGWVLGPLALACLPALEAVAAFLHYLTVDDTGYGCLLHAIQQGARRARTAPPGSLFEALDSVTCAPRSNPNSPRGGGGKQQQQQQNLDRLEKLKARLLGAGSSFKLKPLSAYYKQHRHASSARGSLPAEPLGAAAAAAAQHTGIGPSKLRHASSSPELAGMQLGQPASNSSKPSRSKLGGSASLPGTADGAAGGGVDVEQGGGQPVQGLVVSPEPKQGCAASLASLLTYKLSHVRSSSSGSGSGKHQHLEQLEEQQHAEHGLLSATATEPARQQQQQEQQQRSFSPVASSCGGDSLSELVHTGNCQELCVGRQGQQRVQADALTLEDELAALTGQQADTQGPAQQHGPGGRVAALGVLDSPPRSVSPDLSPTAAARKHGGRGSSGNGSSGGKQQHPLHMRLAPLQRISLEGGGSDAGSSFTNSPCSSMGSITGLVMAAQLHQGYQLQQTSSSSGAASGSMSAGHTVAAPAGGAASSTSSSGSRVGVPAAGVPDARPVSAAHVAGGELSVQSSHAVSVSAMSEIQLQSSTSKVSVSKVSVTGPTAPARRTAA